MDDLDGKRDGEWKLTLWELALLLGIAGVVAGIVVPNLLAGIDRSRQKRTMSDMRSIGTALGSYQVDYGGFPPAPLTSAWSRLEPDYMVAPPTRDGWRSSYRYETPAGQGRLATSYTLVSYGSNRQSDGITHELARYFDCDIVYTDGQFVQAPEGIKKSSDLPVLRSLDLSSRRLDDERADATWNGLGARHLVDTTLALASTELMRAKAPAAYAPAIVAAARGGPPPIERNLRRSLAADTYRNEYLLHAQIHRWFLEAAPPADVDQLNARVYDELFLTPPTDPWVGLVPRDSGGKP